MKHFYQTTPLSKEQYKQALSKAKSQEDFVLKTLSKHKRPLSAYDFSDKTGGKVKPESFRRALTNLKNDNKVVRAMWVKGNCGVPVGAYQLVK